ncbi:TPM domain-containing protein [Bosea sp. LjRoot9]|uniref:TPM domain-containing protein n=1 Tax=Bosea sp. LjRoot9 TaxID=3342341 RepID=UPI003ECDF67A
MARSRLRSLILLAALVFAGAGAWAADPSYPALTGRIVDGAKLIAPEARQRIEAKIKAHEDKAGDQLVVATVPSLQGIGIEDFANGLFRFWKLGEKPRNNGVLFIVAPNERKVRIEVGYGLEGALTDALSKIIITTAVAPKFKTGDFAGGIEGGVDAILTILSGDAEEWQRRALVRNDESSPVETLAVILVMVFIFILVVSFMRGLSQGGGAGRHRLRDGRWITLPQNSSWGSGSGSGSSWGGGGGWSSGGGGGFSGGGGSSGGGGASGDW